MPASKIPYVCGSCQHQTLRQHSPPTQWLRNASSGLPFTERLRRAIWGTDNPPGMEDPYGGPSFWERRQQARAEKRGDSAAAVPLEERTTGSALTSYKPGSPEPEETSSTRSRHDEARRLKAALRQESRPPGRSVSQDPENEDFEYVPAETWDGLEEVGLSGHWSEADLKPEESFRPYAVPYKHGYIPFANEVVVS
jgi:protein kinase C substrate 80K-H